MTDQQLKAWELNLQQARDIVTATKYQRELDEAARHNRAYETETMRHNRATEEAALQQIGVSWHQAHSARMSSQANQANAETNRQNAAVNAWNAAINERNAATNERNALVNERNAETNRMKLDVDWMNAYTNREALGPQWLSAQGAYLRGQAGLASAEVAARKAEYDWALGQLNYSLGQYRAETDRYGVVQNAYSNRMQAEAQRKNANTKFLEYQVGALNSQYQRDLWDAQSQSYRVSTDIEKQWGYSKAKADAYARMADAYYKSKLTDMEDLKWASNTTLGILGAGARYSQFGNMYTQYINQGSQPLPWWWGQTTGAISVPN